MEQRVREVPQSPIGHVAHSKLTVMYAVRNAINAMKKASRP